MKKITLIFSITLISLLFINATVDLANLFNYENQTIPNYITKDNTGSNVITDEIATLGRVLFYDKNLSANNTTSCASCHHQENAFGDLPIQSEGLNGGLTGRHAMRLINSRFSVESKFFWDERATSLEDQTTKPIQDHIEMGYSGTNGDGDINDLILILEQKDYYQTLFNFAFGDNTITENRMQLALAQFIRSIQSFDSKFDEGLAMTNNIGQNFPNYTVEENLGKRIFLDPPPLGGARCNACHQAPEFDINPNINNNGIIDVAGSTTGELDLTNTRAPTLRDLVNPNGIPNGPFMHDGSKATLLDVINHYNSIPVNAANTNLDFRIQNHLNLNLTEQEKNALVVFLETLTGVDVYTNEKWSNPFDENGSITVINGTVSTQENIFNQKIAVYPNPVNKEVTVDIISGNYLIQIYSLNGKLINEQTIFGKTSIDLSFLAKGIFILQIENLTTKLSYRKKLIKK